MLANLVCSLITHRRVVTTLAKAKAARSVAEKMVTLAKSGTQHDRRMAVARLHQEDAVLTLFKDIAPAQKERKGGYTRIVKMHQRQGDAAHLAILEWVDAGTIASDTVTTPATEAAASPAPASAPAPAATPPAPAAEEKK